MKNDKYNCSSALDQVHLNLEKYFTNAEAMDRLRTSLVFDALNYHIAYNSKFASFAKRIAGNSIDNESILVSADMPLLPSSLFKRQGLSVMSASEENVVKTCISSGTSGSISRIGRDEQSLLNFMTTITASLPALFELDRTADYCGIVLGPATNEAGELWFSYVISCINLLMKTSYFEEDHFFDPIKAADEVEKCLKSGKPFVLIGPPLRILQVCEILKGKHLKACSEKSYVISAGGWKSFEHKSILAPEFRTIVMLSLGISSESQIRDSFNMVELNTVISECSHHRKHIPPWLIVQSRDVKTNAVLPDGQFGILSFMDAGALSYPCFILSEDFGMVDSNPCSCGRIGGTFQIARRMTKVEQRGCALKMSGGQRSQNRQASSRFFTSVYRNPEFSLSEDGNCLKKI